MRSVPIYITCRKALAESSIFLKRSVDFITVSEYSSENNDGKPRRDGNTWLWEVIYEKKKICSTVGVSSMIGTEKKKKKKKEGWIGWILNHWGKNVVHITMDFLVVILNLLKSVEGLISASKDIELWCGSWAAFGLQNHRNIWQNFNHLLKSLLE